MKIDYNIKRFSCPEPIERQKVSFLKGRLCIKETKFNKKYFWNKILEFYKCLDEWNKENKKYIEDVIINVNNVAKIMIY